MKKLAVVACACLLGAAAPCVQAADVYAAVASDGTMRYASQPLDPSYSLLFTDSQAPAAGALQPRSYSAAADSMRPIIERVATRHGMSAALVEAVIAVESGFNAAAVSGKGARGPMQLMPATGQRYGLNEARDFHQVEQNIDAGVRHLKDLITANHGNVALALAAYNAGAGAVARSGNRIPPTRETMLYVPAVMSRASQGATR